MYILLAILVFGILIAVHELGHFLVAKACGVRVDEFAIGMGPAIWKKQKGETLYAVRCLPIGGFCAMAGEDEAIDDPRAFTSQPAWKRFLILCAGAFMNFVFGLLLLLIVFAQAKSFSTPTLTDFMDGCPYQGENALQVGDTIWSIDGHRIYFTTNVSEYLARGGDTHDIVVKRDGEKVALNDFYLVAREYPGQDGKMYGFYFGTRPATFGAKLQTTWYSAMDFVRMAWMGLSDLFAGAVGVKDLSGPVGIVSMMNEVGK
ncbi:membrane-associated zinc metalloprotease, partial [human gut metagenome]